MSSWKQRHSQIIVAAVGAVTLLISFLLLDGAEVSAFESNIFTALNSLPDRLDSPVRAVMLLGTTLAIPASALAAFLLRRQRLSLGLLFAGTAAWVLSNVVKYAVERGRPSVLLDEVVIRGDPAEGFGYVSGHTSVAFALAACAMWALNSTGRVIVVTLAAIVGFARIYVGAHMPADVIGGAALGVIVGSLVQMALPGERN